MFAMPFRNNSRFIAEADRVSLRHPEMADYDQWASLRQKSAQFLQPWEPRWPRDDLSKIAFRARLRRYNAEIKARTGLPLYIIRQEDQALLGGITLGHIRRGASQSAQIGYWIGQEFARQGYMREALELLCHYSFSQLGLHRLEAACIPTNTASLTLLEKAGFEREGHLRSYLKINGSWQDHILYARINPLSGQATPATIFRAGDQ